ncbi:hypothetical protein M3J09_007989 [Ascochyta lentis]
MCQAHQRGRLGYCNHRNQGPGFPVHGQEPLLYNYGWVHRSELPTS